MTHFEMIGLLLLALAVGFICYRAGSKSEKTAAQKANRMEAFKIAAESENDKLKSEVQNLRTRIGDLEDSLTDDEAREDSESWSPEAIMALREQGLTFGEIAKITGLKKSTVSGRYYRLANARTNET